MFCQVFRLITDTDGEGNMKTKARKLDKAIWGSAAPNVLLLIFSRLPPASLARVSVVCTAWHKVVQSISVPWEKFFEEQRKELKFRLPQLDFDVDIKAAETITDFKTRAIVERQRAHLVHGIMRSRWWKAHTARVNCCRMSMDNIVSGSSDQRVRIWSATSLRCLEEYRVDNPKSPVVDLEFDTNKILGATGAEVWIWNRNRGGRIIHKMGGHGFRLYCLSCTDSEAAVGCADGSTRIYDLYGGRCSRIFRNHSAAVTSVSVNEETQLLASGCRDGSVQVCDSSSGEIVGRLLRPAPYREVECLQWGRDGHLLYAGTSVGRICCWDIRKEAILWQEWNDKSVIGSLHLQEYSPETLVTGSMDGRVRIWDSIRGNLLNNFKPSDSFTEEAGLESSWIDTAVSSIIVSNSSSVMLPPKQVPILCVRVGSTRVLTAHTDGSLALCQFRVGNHSSNIHQWDF